MKFDKNDTAVVMIDPQNEVLSETGLGWPRVFTKTTPLKIWSASSKPQRSLDLSSFHLTQLKACRVTNPAILVRPSARVCCPPKFLKLQTGNRTNSLRRVPCLTARSQSWLCLSTLSCVCTKSSTGNRH